jgi:peptidoglycan/xylan/chitin deacetylase (PgdA/CDA1 family)
MKKTIRDTLVSLIHYAGIAWLYRCSIGKNVPRVRVIAFHDIHNREWFETILARLVEEFHIVTPEQFEKSDFRTGVTNVLVTFDDGYESWVTVGLPTLQKYGVRGIFFINSGLLQVGEDQERAAQFTHDRLKVGERVLLKMEDADALRRAGHTIGGHTMHHTRLTEVSAEEVRKEVEEDKKFLETELATSLHHFAYPFGTHRDYSEATHRIVHSVGYTYLYSAEPGYCRDSGSLIPRTLIESEQSYQSLALWLYGAYDLFSLVKRCAVRYSSS